MVRVATGSGFGGLDRVITAADKSSRQFAVTPVGKNVRMVFDTPGAFTTDAIDGESPKSTNA